jgi:hypothetical protein
MFGFLPHNLYTGHNAANTSGLSPRLWSRVTGSMMASDGNRRLVLAGDDFNAIRIADTQTDLFSEMNYNLWSTDAEAVVGMSDEYGGVLLLPLASTVTDNDEIWIEAGDATQQLGRICAVDAVHTTVADYVYLTAFECRVKFSSIVDGVCSFFAGLATPGTAANNALVDDTGAIKATTSFIGFRNLINGDNIQCIYQSSADSAAVINVAAAGTLAADTFVKLGFIYDPAAVPAKRITWYIDNVELSTYVTKTQVETATFPNNEALTFLFGYKNTIGTTPASCEGCIDWWSFAQLI